jgi:hypothetical protein
MKPTHDIRLKFGIDELDEISGDEQLMLVWCATHETWEWHWLPIDPPRPKLRPMPPGDQNGRKRSAARHGGQAHHGSRSTHDVRQLSEYECPDKTQAGPAASLHRERQ